MNIAARIWWRAIVIYFWCMIPCLLMPIMFVLAMGLAIICSLPALLLFLPIPELMRRAGLTYPVAAFILLLLTGMVLCYGATYWACFIMKDSYQTPLEAMKEWIVFPLVAWGATLISVISLSRTIAAYFTVNTSKQA